MDENEHTHVYSLTCCKFALHWTVWLRTWCTRIHNITSCMLGDCGACAEYCAKDMDEHENTHVYSPTCFKFALNWTVRLRTYLVHPNPQHKDLYFVADCGARAASCAKVMGERRSTHVYALTCYKFALN